MKLFDLTVPISSKTPVFPGDPKFKKEEICHLKNGDNYGLSRMEMGNHMGTHIDFPAHVIENEKVSSDYPLEQLIGNGLIVEVPEVETSITSEFITRQSIQKGDIVFFKTSNSKLWNEETLSNKYVYLEPEAAEQLVQQGVKIVGIDYISIDSLENEKLPVHHTLLSNDVLIVEGLNMEGVPPGRYKIYIVPLNILDMDGLPARVFVTPSP